MNADKRRKVTCQGTFTVRDIMPVWVGCHLFSPRLTPVRETNAGITDSETEDAQLAHRLKILARIEKYHLDFAHAGVPGMRSPRAGYPVNKVIDMIHLGVMFVAPRTLQMSQLCVPNPVAPVKPVENVKLV